MFNFVAKNGKEGLSESVFYATNATPGTGIASKDAPTSFSATAGILNIYNSASTSAGDNQYVIPVYIRLTATTANTSATNFRLVGSLDVIDRYSSGGTALTGASTSADTRTGYASRTPKATIYAGELTLAAASSAKRVFNTYVSQAVLTADESLEIWFGEAPSGSLGDNVKVVPPVWIGRGCSLAIHEIAASQAADPAFEYEVCWIEAGHPRFNA
jgi:hypothetical protein